MDNSFFRNLVNNTPRVDRSSASTNATSTSSAAPSLGSRQRSSIPMTPRSVGGATSFAQQAAAYRLQQNPPKEKKFKSSVPLGSNLPQGYVDRTKLRDDEDVVAADAEQRIAALMKLVEEGALTREEAIEQSKAFGGDASSTHLVKGLDFKLLERARKGEDVLAEKKKDEVQDEEDIEDELDQALEKKVESVKRQRKEERDDDDDAPKKKTRAEILAEWKKSREEAAAKKAAESALGSKFKKFGEREKKAKTVKDEKSTKASKDGTSGKKRKRVHEEASKEKIPGNGTVLGMLPPELPSTKAVSTETQDEDEDVNIFDDAPDDYDPLAGLASSDDDSELDKGEVEDKPAKEKETRGDMPPPLPPSTRPRNYFATSSKDAGVSPGSISSTPLSGQDLANTMELSAAIKKAAQMRTLSKADLDDEEAKKAARHKAMLQAASRDDEDVDMGFGGSRTFGDDDDDDLGVTKKKKRGKKNA
ncbi:uncharacterized protein DFL_004265 [Arthrobotrys flagrans]|uniref:RED-like N-terminal domain-containing protein n=1 Tax=Arthrobotrys flagrans TaxID=97331 RepID=A0A437A4B5_ARTFL|nr:hypothetical protein DFL_004265 [Arthrobotrys flagrans]